MCHKLRHFIFAIWWFHTSKDFEAMKAGKLAICSWLVCQYKKNTLLDLPSSVLNTACLETQNVQKRWVKIDIHQIFAKKNNTFYNETQRKKNSTWNWKKKLNKTYDVHRLAAAYLGGVCYSRREEIDAQIR